MKILKVIMTICVLHLVLACNSQKYLYTHKEKLSDKESSEIKNCVYNNENIKRNIFNGRSYVYLNNKKTDLYITKNKTDNRYYIGVKRSRYLLPIEIDCENLFFREYENEDALMDSEVRDNSIRNSQISIIWLDSDKKRPFEIGEDHFVQGNTFGTVCEFDSNGNLINCIRSRHYYEIDSIGNVKETYVY